VYFWSFVVSVLIFLVGAGVSVWQGVLHVMDPPQLDRPLVSFGVLGLAAVFEGASWWVAIREFRRHKGDRGYLEAAHETKDPSTLLLLLEDGAALVGILIAFTGLALAHLLDEPRFDGIASIAIGGVLAMVAWFLASESKQLLIGEPAHGELRESVRDIAEGQDGVRKCNGLLSFQLGPDTVAIAMSVVFEAELKAREIERVVEKLEEDIRKKHPEVALLVAKPQSTKAWEAARKRLGLR